MRRIVFAPSFDQEIEDVGVYIEVQFGEEIRRQFVANIATTCSLIANFPRLGKSDHGYNTELVGFVFGEPKPTPYLAPSTRTQSSGFRSSDSPRIVSPHGTCTQTAAPLSSNATGRRGIHFAVNKRTAPGTVITPAPAISSVVPVQPVRRSGTLRPSVAPSGRANAYSVTL